MRLVFNLAHIFTDYSSIDGFLLKLSKGFVEKLEHNSLNFTKKMTVQIGKHVYAFFGNEVFLSVEKYQNIACVTAGCSPPEKI